MQGDKERLAEDIASACRNLAVDLVLLPAGYLCTNEHHEGHEKQVAARLASFFGDRAVVGGVDAARSRQVDDRGGKGAPLVDKWTKAGNLPFWLFASEKRGQLTPHGFVQQRSTLYNYDLVPSERHDLAPTAPRVVRVGGLRVYLLACGEIFNPAVQQAIVSLQGQLDLVAHLAHRGLGRSFGRTYPTIARGSGAWVVNAQHIGESAVGPRKWGVGPRTKSVHWRPGANAWVGSRTATTRNARGLWAEVACWEVPLSTADA